MTPMQIVQNIAFSQQELTDKINYLPHDQNLTDSDRLLLLMHLGAKYIILNSDLLTFRGLIDPTQPGTAAGLLQMQVIASLPITDVLKTREYYTAFAQFAHYLGYYNFVELSINYGARLNYNSYFMEIYNSFRIDPNFAQYTGFLSQLLFDDKRQPWDSKDPYVPAAACSAYLQSQPVVTSPPVPQPEISQAQLEPAIVPDEIPAPPKTPEVPDVHEPSIKPATPLPVTPDTPAPVPAPQPEPEPVQPTIPEPEHEPEPLIPLPAGEELAATTPAQTIEQERILETPEMRIDRETTHALKEFDADLCNKYIAEAPEIFTPKFEALMTRKLGIDQKAYEELLPKLNYTAAEWLRFSKVTQPKKGFRIMLLRRILLFEDQQILDLHTQVNLYETLGKLLNKDRSEDQELKTQFRSRLRRHTRAVKEATPNTESPAPVQTKALTEPPTIATDVTPLVESAPLASIETVAPESATPDIRKALLENDFDTLNRYGFTTKEQITATVLAITEMLIRENCAISPDLLYRLELPTEFYGHLIHRPDLPKASLHILLNALLRFDLESYFIFDMQHNMEATLKCTLDPDTTTHDDQVLLSRISLKSKTATLVAAREAESFFAQLANIEPYAKVSVKSYIFLASTKRDSDQKSSLMCAIEKSLHIDVIKGLILAANSTGIAMLDNNNRSVFHYWARYPSKDSATVIGLLWDRFKEFMRLYPNPLEIINAQEADTGNTFLHTMLETFAPRQALLLAASLFNLGYGKQFAAAILLRNNRGKTPLDIVEEATEYHKDLTEQLLMQLSRACFPLAALLLNTPDQLAKYFPKTVPFFGSRVQANIQQLLDRGKYKRIADMVILHNALRLPLRHNSIFEFFAPPANDAQRAKIEQLKDVVLDHFGEIELLQTYQYRPKPNEILNKLLLVILNEEAVKPANADLLRKMDLPMFDDLETMISIDATVPWLRVEMHFRNPRVITLSATELHDYAVRLKPRVNLLNSITGLSALDLAIYHGNLELTKFLHRECEARITPAVLQHALFKAFRTTADNPNPQLNSANADIANYLYNHSTVKKDPKTALSAAVVMFKEAAKTPISYTLLLWLINHNFTYDITFVKDDHLLHLVMREVNDQNFETAYPAIRAMLNPHNETSGMLAKKDSNGFTPIYYILQAGLLKHLSPENVRKILELYFAASGSLLDIGLKRGTALHLILLLKDEDLLASVLSKLKATDFKKFATYSDANTKCILVTAHNMMSTNPAQHVLYDMIFAKFDQYGLPLPSIAEAGTVVDRPGPKPTA